MSAISQQHSIARHPVRALLRQRWLILLVSASLLVLIEAFQGYPIEVSLREVLFYGFIIPVSVWLALGLLSRSVAQHASHENALKQHQRLARRLAQYHEYGELTRYIVQFPATLLPVDHASLFVYDHRNARLEYVTEWSAAEASSPTLRYLESLTVCPACLSPRSRRVYHTGACAFAADAHDHSSANEHSLALWYDKVLVGVLRLRCRPGNALTPDHIAFLNRISPEVALALVLSIAHTRQLDHARIEAQLDERRRLSYDLHNSLAQHIGYLHLSLDRLASDSGVISNGSILSELKRLREVASDAYEQVRANLSFLRAWQQVDLTQAIDQFACTIARRADLAIDLRTAGAPARLSPLTCQHIFSLVQEGLCNVEKHAQARRVEIALDWTSDDLRLSLSDDGIGFDPAAVPDGHYGLAMMAERIQRLGGERRIETAPGAGTRLNFRIPLRLLRDN